ncbi:MAG: MBL fold metallo-hydrolase [Deltaproteobacteria bacterium]|nr:MBL fold metallo-hydrolase [Deltaproteobacteria bacterium]
MEDHTKIENITIFWGRQEGALIYSNSIVVDCGRDKVIIDPSAESDGLKELSGQGASIVNSHYHGDHRRLNYLFTNSEFFAPELDAPMLESNEQFIDAVGIEDTEVKNQWLDAVKNLYNIVEHRIAGTFKDGEYVIDRSYGIKAVGLPGHTQGHSGFFIESASLTILTDIDLTRFGPWYGNEASDIDAFLDSIEKAKHVQSKYFMSSHTNQIYTREQIVPLLDQFASYISRRERQILGLIDMHGPLSLEQMSRYGIIYPKSSLDNNPALAFFEKKMLEKHLKRMHIAYDGRL